MTGSAGLELARDRVFFWSSRSFSFVYSPAWGWTLDGVEEGVVVTTRSFAEVILWCEEEDEKEERFDREECERSRVWLRGADEPSSSASSAKLRSLGAWWWCCGFCLGGGGGFLSLVVVVVV